MRMIATGFLRNAPDDTNEAELNRPLERNEIVARVTESVREQFAGTDVQLRGAYPKDDPVTRKTITGWSHASLRFMTRGGGNCRRSGALRTFRRGQGHGA